MTHQQRVAATRALREDAAQSSKIAAQVSRAEIRRRQAASRARIESSTGAALTLGLLLRSRYDLFQWIDVPTVHDTVQGFGVAGVFTVAMLLSSLVAAIAGGKLDRVVRSGPGRSCSGRSPPSGSTRRWSGNHRRVLSEAAT